MYKEKVSMCFVIVLNSYQRFGLHDAILHIVTASHI